MNYYCLVAGLPDLHVEDAKGFLPPEDLRAELIGQLSPADAKLLTLLYARYDNQNFLKYLKQHDAVLNPLGNLRTEDWEELLGLMQEAENPQDSRLLPYFVSYYHYIQEEEHLTNGIAPEDYLSGLYFEYAMKVDNQFLRSWFEFNLNLNNLLTAIACRKHGYDQQKLIIGHNEIARMLRHTHARDFGIGNLFEYTDEVIKAAEEIDLMEREKKIDALKWVWLDEHTFFNYFSVEKVLAFVLKTEMLERWKMLSFEAGAAIFRDLLNSLKQGVIIKA
ncbi:MAG: DUF2764 family protein [Paludibacter sp.]|nr:DUF2764 family protein [Paludibacter sp.]